jgi:CubicO group peptidase (beta-lactamase class C family)
LRWLSSLFITLCIINFGGWLWESNASERGIIDIDTSRVSAIFQKYENIKSPGIVVMVIQKGKIQFAKGYGYTDLDLKQKLTSSTLFRLASVSKQFTAMAIMTLTERGMLDFDDPVVRWIPELKQIGKKITIRHFLNHTSGLPDYSVVPAQPDINIPLDNATAISTY